MAMPNDLVFVRHGESEANIVQQADKSGLSHAQNDEVFDRPDWEQRLSSRGIEQVKQARAWVDQHLGGAKSFDLRYFSPFLRTRETAAYLGGEDCGNWIMDDRVVERSWGIYGMLSRAEREKKFEQTAKMYRQSPWYTKLDGGESRYEVSDRFRDFQGTLHREADGKRVLVVTHGDFMGVARYNLERMLPEQFEKVEHDPTQDVKNCAIFHYSRINPSDPEDVRPKLSFRRLVNPTDLASSPFDGEWRELPQRPKFTGAELLAQADRAPRLIPGE
jgi:broad specificity phosphatase PhoE